MEVRIMMEIIRSSVIVSAVLRICEGLSRAWQESLVKRFAAGIGSCWRSSNTGVLLKKYIEKEPFYRSSVTYRVIMKVFGFFDRILGRIHGAAARLGVLKKSGAFLKNCWKESLLCRAFTRENCLSTSLCGRGIRFTAGWTVARGWELAVLVLAAYGIIDVVLRRISGTLGSVWDELFLMAMILLCVVKWTADRRDIRLKTSPLDLPLVMFMGVMIFCLLVNSPDFSISLEGFRAVVQYMLWYFVVLQLVKGEDSAKAITAFFVAVVALLALYGVYQYVIGVEMPAGWTDHNEASLRTRVYSIFTSPNAFGSLLTLAAPMSVSLMAISRSWKQKAVFGCMTLCILASLAFTFSRGAWMGFIAAAGVYVLIKDRRLLVPCVICGLLVVVLVPSIGGRIAYMLSPEYIESSLRGGRLVRWLTGLEILKDYPVLGVGLGHFGGAVAMNHDVKFIVGNQVTVAFYMDNYMLKTAVEAGLAGLAAFLALMYSVVINGLRTVRDASTSVSRELSAGILAGLCGVIVHNLVENIFEVPMMTSLFWMFAAVLMGIWFYDHQR